MLSIIVAKAENNIIGGDNKLLWHISEDLKRFKEITTNHTIIMGRKTFESLPKVLPNRHHVIITRDISYTVDSDQVTILHNLGEVIKRYEHSEEEAFIIGGGEIYNLLFPYAKKLYLTKVNKDFEGDTYFPIIDFNEWTIVESSDEKINAEDSLKYNFVNLIRR
ncbi:dihydrofolate reductase [Clostridium sp. SHJSY1]|uniref:dihydrofolate reductase n=1 Tax=Clostridium sp. SHJSY1 TaxID=2942483 RepID=UPI002876D45C|nr:dihydrofolate reductase [Clostridium sp. SHJSY1]MDS0527233.1 dihydrofolate reductase [Clostridium sp. SHJSY1]